MLATQLPVAVAKINNGAHVSLTKEQALMIVEAHELQRMLGDDEERELLIENNPDLYEAYCELLELAGLAEDEEPSL